VVLSQAFHVLLRSVMTHNAGCLQAGKQLARAQRQLDAAQAAKADVAWELQELSAATRGRVKGLLLANEGLDRRAHDLSQQLLSAVPARAYCLLLDKYKAALAHRRDSMVDSNQSVLAAEDAKQAAQRQLAGLEQRYVAACGRAAAAEEAQRVAEKALEVSGRDGSVSAELSGDLRKRAVELETARQQSDAADRKAARLQEDVAEAEAQLRRVREEFAQQAKRALLLTARPCMHSKTPGMFCMSWWLALPGLRELLCSTLSVLLRLGSCIQSWKLRSWRPAACAASCKAHSAALKPPLCVRFSQPLKPHSQSCSSSNSRPARLPLATALPAAEHETCSWQSASSFSGSSQ
jgi:hypothetical protein